MSESNAETSRPKAYPPDISWSDPFPIMPMSSLLNASIERFSDRPCLDFLDRKYSYAEVGNLVDRVARGLQEIGVTKGTRVGLFLPNTPYSVIFLFAVTRIGAIVVNFNPLYAGDQVRHQIIDSGTELMVTVDLELIYPKLAERFADTGLRKIIMCRMADILPFPKNLLYPIFKHGEVAAYPDDHRHIPFHRLIGNPGNPDPVEIDPMRDIALLQYTGGTTGTPKGAMLTHRNAVVNAQQCLRWNQKLHPGEEKVLAVLPFFHVFALTVAGVLGIAVGGEIILLPRFEIDVVLKTISTKKVTLFPAVPTIFTAINHYPKLRNYDLSSIRSCISGGAPLPVEVKTTFEQLTGCVLVEGYGLSETSPVATCNPYFGVNKPGSIGLPVPGTVVEIRSLDDPRKPVPEGERGEVCIRGPQVMAGYWQKPEETAQTLEDGVLLHTGDVGYRDEEGYIYLVDRIKDLILAGGYNVYPRNVEDAIYKHPDVIECVVIGIPDPYRGQTVKAFIVPRPDAVVTEAGIKSFLKDKLSPIEMPKAIEFRTSLPKTMVGKLSKKVLVEEEAARAAQVSNLPV